jgi:SAM-dependent methyltransferase
MADYELAPEILDYYTTSRDEAARLVDAADGRLELLRTQELLRRHLPPAPADVLDVGGGTGAHSRWLAGDGHRVRLVDPVPHHVEAARAAGIGADVGDARRLPVDDASVDVVFLAGPMYHLVEREDRDRALAEARRVLRPGGMLAVAAINRYASFFENAAIGVLEREGARAAVESIARTGVLFQPPRGHFTTAFFHEPAQLLEEVAAAGFVDGVVYSVEGPAWGLLKAAERNGEKISDDDPLFLSVLAAAQLAEPFPALMASASHLLAVASVTL